MTTTYRNNPKVFLVLLSKAPLSFHGTYCVDKITQLASSIEINAFLSNAHMPLDFQEVVCRGAPDALERPGIFDAIVIGAGAAGGLAAERLTQGGLKVLLLDAGLRLSALRAPGRKLINAVAKRLCNPGYLPALSPALINAGRHALQMAGRIRQPVQTKCYAWERRPEAFVDDFDCPYTTTAGRPFTWIRGRGLQGRLGIPGHGRLYFRLGPDDFAPLDGKSQPWPLAIAELAPWYMEVEKRLGMHGGQEGLAWLPDSEITTPESPTEAEAALMAQIKSRWPQFRPVIGRHAPPPDTLWRAALSGRLTLREGAIVREILVRDGRVQGVAWCDATSQSNRKAAAPMVFLCASALESTRILLLSKDDATGHGIGAQSDALGRYLMDHIMVKAEGMGPALPGPGPTQLLPGRCVYLPRFDARDQEKPAPGRGFGLQLYQASSGKDRSFFWGTAFSEMLPRPDNRVVLNRKRLDRWGIPVLQIDCSHGAEDFKRAAEQMKALREVGDAAGIRLSSVDAAPAPPGTAVHECGTARMGLDPANSVLDPHNQCWDAAGLYVTDSASFPSQGSQNPTLTVMALTARACAHALQV
jgi:choline dehydrogenase-like flavoprotein